MSCPVGGGLRPEIGEDFVAAHTTSPGDGEQGQESQRLPLSRGTADGPFGTFHDRSAESTKAKHQDAPEAV